MIPQNELRLGNLVMWAHRPLHVQEHHIFKSVTDQLDFNPMAAGPGLLRKFGFKKEGEWFEIEMPKSPYVLALSLINHQVNIVPSNRYDHTGILFDFEMEFHRIQNLYFALTGQELKPHEESENSDNS